MKLVTSILECVMVCRLYHNVAYRQQVAIRTQHLSINLGLIWYDAGMTTNTPPVQRVDVSAPLPVFLRGIRALHGISSLRAVGRPGGITAGHLSRLERGQAVPSVELLYRWTVGVGDGRPVSDLWAAAVAAAAATWPDDMAYALVRLLDERRSPDSEWRLAHAAGVLTASCIREAQDASAIGDEGELEPEVRAVIVEATHVVPEALLDTGGRRFPRFRTAVQSPASALDAAIAAWWSLVRQADEPVLAEMAREILGPDGVPWSRPGPLQRAKMYGYLAEVFQFNGHRPVTMSGASASPRRVDAQQLRLDELWPGLEPGVRRALLTLAEAAVLSPRDDS